MTDSMRGAGGPQGPPWSVDVLADLHAGVLDPAESARLWPLVNADPDARAVLAALEEVKVGLGRLGNAPVEPMPAQYAAKLDAAIAAEARASGRVATAPAPQQAPVSPTPPAQVVDLAAARKRRNRMAAWGAGVLTAAAAAVAVTFVALPGNETTGTPSAQDDGGAVTQTEAPGAGAQPPLALTANDLGAAVGPLTGKKDYGGLNDEQGLRDCLAAHEVDMPGSPIGVSPVEIDGKDGVAALVPAGPPVGRLRIVVVEPTCTAGSPGEKFADSTIG